MKSERICKGVALLCLVTIFCLFGLEKIESRTAAAFDTTIENQPLSRNSLLACLPSRPDIIVNTTSDVADFGGAQQVGDLPGPDGLVTLREAIIAANNTPGRHKIAFHIPTNDSGFDGSVFTIKPLESLPTISGDGLIIDGSTQTAFSGNTNVAGPEIVLDGSGFTPSGGTYGLGIRTAHNRIHALVIHSFFSGIVMGGTLARENVITGCFIGTDANGAVARPTFVGVDCGWGPSHNIIGGLRASDRNLISGNTHIGVFLENPQNFGTTGNMIIGNLIGTDITGTLPLSNGAGIYIANGTTDTLIAKNVIAYNSQYGILINDAEKTDAFSTGNTISRNSIFSNSGERAIGLMCATCNTDPDPGDTDIGPNNLMNYPVLTSAKATPGRLVVKGTIDTPNPHTVTIEFFANPVPIPGGDPSGYGEGAIFLGQKRPNSQGKFTATLPPVSIGTIISATATDANGNTSEFALNIEAN